MKNSLSLFTMCAILFVFLLSAENYTLPSPDYTGSVPLEKALNNRSSVRQFTNASLNKQQISQILWAAQGLRSGQNRFRTAPSAGAVYPIHIYLILADDTESLSAGLYKYNPAHHSITRLKQEKGLNAGLAATARNQRSIVQAPVSILMTVEFDKITARYGDFGVTAAHMEAGHISQNIYLQAYVLGLGTVAIGSIDPPAMKKFLDIREEETPVYLMPVGVPQPR